MKKVVTVLVCVFSMVILTSCIDQNNELEERIQIENELQLIDPEDNGEIDEEDHRED